MSTKQSKTKSMYFDHRAKKSDSFERTGKTADIRVNELEHIPSTEYMLHLGTWYDRLLNFDRQLNVLLGKLQSKFEGLKSTIFNNKLVPAWLRKKILRGTICLSTHM